MAKLSSIGIVGVSSALREGEEDRYRYGIKYLEDLGLKVTQAPNIFSRTVYAEDGSATAGTLEERLEGFHEVWSNSEVEVVIAIRGGYGAIQLVDQIDYSMIRSKPKPFMGFSDLTVLHMAFAKKIGLQCFHTPMPSKFQEWNPETEKSFLALLEQIDVSSPLHSAQFSETGIFNSHFKALYEHSNFKVDEADLKVLGGNLTLFSGLLGTELVPDLKGAVLFLEDYMEPKYKIDRMLQHLRLAGVFEEISAIAVGIPTEAEFAYEVLEEISKRRNIPLIKDIPVGHCETNLSLALG